MPRKATIVDPAKQIMIKTKTVQRLKKEHQYYHTEVAENEEKLAKMKADDADFYDIKKFQEVLDESNMMVPDSQSRLKKSVDELSDFLSKNPDLEGVEWFTTAEELLAEKSDS